MPPLGLEDEGFIVSTDNFTANSSRMSRPEPQLEETSARGIGQVRQPYD